MPSRFKTHRIQGSSGDRNIHGKKESDINIQRARKIRSHRKWREFRRPVLSLPQNRFCEDPFNEHGPLVVSTVLHHKIPIAINPDLAFDEGNVIGWCKACHDRFEGEERARNRNSKS